MEEGSREQRQGGAIEVHGQGVEERSREQKWGGRTEGRESGVMQRVQGDRDKYCFHTFADDFKTVGETTVFFFPSLYCYYFMITHTSIM